MINFFFDTDPWSIGPIVGGGILTLVVFVIVGACEWFGWLEGK